MLVYNYHTMTTKTKNNKNTNYFKKKGILIISSISLLGILLTILIAVLWITLFENKYNNKVYPAVYINNVSFDQYTQEQVKQYWLSKNIPFEKLHFVFRFNDKLASISGKELDLGFDATLSAKQAYLVGRSNNILSDIYTKFFIKKVNLTPYFRWKTQLLDNTLLQLSDFVNIPVRDALFEFENNRVVEFRSSQMGKELNIQKTKKIFQQQLGNISSIPNAPIDIEVAVDDIAPEITTEEVNSFGISELIGTGFSLFHGSIPGRIHNVALAASRLNGVLIKPGEIFSFNNVIGDISAATGYQSAYIIKEGRTVLGDGGGVCQVSTTLFRAALDAGLPIVERRAHAYRVHYYEDGGYKPGLDATVFSPSVDLKIKNDTNNHILIQTKTHIPSVSLTFELFGTSDGRVSEILNHNVWGQTPAPPPKYQDDPTLEPGEVKQVDWAASGAKASFDYKVTKNNTLLHEETFYSNFRPWQAVYLKGPDL